MKNINLIGIGGKKYEQLRSKLEAAIAALQVNVEITEVSEVDDILKFDLSAIPAIAFENHIIYEPNTPEINIDDLKILLGKHLQDMKTILVPTDFSPAAANAYEYAKELAQQLNSIVKVVHIQPPVNPPDDVTAPNFYDSIHEMKREQLENFIQQGFSKKIEDVVIESLIDRELIVGLPVNELIKLSKSPEVSLIVMGATGENTWVDKIFGRISASVSRKAHCPVLLIPQNQKFTTIDNVMYASNYQAADDTMLNRMVDFAKMFNANIHLVHVAEKQKEGEAGMGDFILEHLFKKKLPDSDLKMTTISSDTIQHGLKEYAEQNGIDLLVIVTKHRNFWEELRHKSITQQMVLEAALPIMVMHLES